MHYSNTCVRISLALRNKKLKKLTLFLPHADVAEWQTHQTQNLTGVTSCGFKSRHPHYYKEHILYVLFLFQKEVSKTFNTLWIPLFIIATLPSRYTSKQFNAFKTGFTNLLLLFDTELLPHPYQLLHNQLFHTFADYSNCELTLTATIP